MTSLTEQWKKRTLRNGAFYIKTLGGDILPAFCNTEYILKQFQTMKGIYDDVAEVLAPVPSYDKWQQLKELLKECKNILERRCYIENNVSLDAFIKQIDEVLK